MRCTHLLLALLLAAAEPVAGIDLGDTTVQTLSVGPGADGLGLITFPYTSQGISTHGPLTIVNGEVLANGSYDPLGCFGYNGGIAGTKARWGEPSLNWCFEGDWNDGYGGNNKMEAYLTMGSADGLSENRLEFWQVDRVTNRVIAHTMNGTLTLNDPTGATTFFVADTVGGGLQAVNGAAFQVASNGICGYQQIGSTGDGYQCLVRNNAANEIELGGMLDVVKAKYLYIPAGGNLRIDPPSVYPDLNQSNASTLAVRGGLQTNNIGGTTTANATTHIVGVGTKFGEQLGPGDQISLSSAPTAWATVTHVTNTTHLSTGIPLGDGSTQTINVRKSALLAWRSDGVPSFSVDNDNHQISFRDGTWDHFGLDAGCGIGASASGADHAAHVIIGTSPTSACVMTFTRPMPVPPVCVCNNETSDYTCRVSSPSVTTITLNGTFTASDKIGVLCSVGIDG